MKKGKRRPLRRPGASAVFARRRAIGQGKGTTEIEHRRVERVDEPIKPMREKNPLFSILRSGPTVRPFRDDGYLHVSDLVGKCLRKMAIAEKYATPMPAQELWDSQGITFAIGEALHGYVVDRFQQEEDTLFGSWTCLCRKTRIDGPYTLRHVREHDLHCDHCRQPTTVYDELRLKNERLNLVGNADCAFLRNGYLFLGELKTINKKGWDELARGPSPDYLVQILLYWWMARELGYRLFDHVSILYVAKDWMMKTPYKEFPVNAIDNMHRISMHLEEAEELANFRFRGGPLPRRTVCPTINCPKAKQCELAEECFKEPSE